MEDRAPRTVSRIAGGSLVAWSRSRVGRGLRRACTRDRARWPALGAVAVAGGSGLWAAGEASIQGGSERPSRPLVNAGLRHAWSSGLAAIVAAGGWMAASVACNADPDCPEEEQCREVPAPPGGIPYKQCIPR